MLSGLEFSDEAKQTFAKMYLSNGVFVNAIQNMQKEISQNAFMEDQLYNGVIWNRKYTYYMNLIWGIRDDLGEEILSDLDKELKVSQIFRF